MTTTKSEFETSPRPTSGDTADDPRRPRGVLAAQQLRRARAEGWIGTSTLYDIWRDETIQPASIDLRLGEYAWPLRCSFLPDASSTVQDKAEDLRFENPIDIRNG